MKKILIALLFFIAAHPLMAQDEGNSLYSIQYSIGFPTGSFHDDFIARTSFRGVSIDFRKMVNEDMFAGLEFGWNVFYSKLENAIATEGTTTISGTQFRYMSVFPILVNFGYSRRTSENLTTYAALGLGTIYNRSRLDIGIWQFTNEAWHFALKPEIGLFYKTGHDMGILLNGKYYSAFETDKSMEIAYFTANLGLIWIF
jgi:outer membrane protein